MGFRVQQAKLIWLRLLLVISSVSVAGDGRRERRLLACLAVSDNKLGPAGT